MIQEPHKHPLLDENSPENAKFRSLIEYIRIAHEVNLESFFKGKRRREFIIRKFIDAAPLPFSVKSKLQDNCDSDVGFLVLSGEDRQALDGECEKMDDGTKNYQRQMDQLIKVTTLLSSARGDSDDFHEELKLLAREAGHYRATNFLYEQLDIGLAQQQSADEIAQKFQNFWDEREAEVAEKQREQEAVSADAKRKRKKGSIEDTDQ